MSKRFADTDKYKKAFIRSLKGPYKLLWDYICLDCNHAGIWQVDFQVARIYLGGDMPVNETDALAAFNADEQRIIPFNGGKKWFIRPFIDFQYGTLNPENRAHQSVLQILEKEGLKGHISPFQGAMDMDKDKVKDKDNTTGGCKGEPRLAASKYPQEFDTFWQAYPRKVGKAAALKRWKTQKPPLTEVLKALELQRGCAQWQDITLIPHPETWLNKRRWEDDPAAYAPAKPKTDNHAYCEADSLQGGN